MSKARSSPRQLNTIDPTKHPWEQKEILHNRWHPDIPHVSPPTQYALSICPYSSGLFPSWHSEILIRTCHCHAKSPDVALVQINTIKEDEVVRVETLDWTGGQIKDNDSADDMKNIDLSLVSLCHHGHTDTCLCTPIHKPALLGVTEAWAWCPASLTPPLQQAAIPTDTPMYWSMQRGLQHCASSPDACLNAEPYRQNSSGPEPTLRTLTLNTHSSHSSWDAFLSDVASLNSLMCCWHLALHAMPAGSKAATLL